MRKDCQVSPFRANAACNLQTCQQAETGSEATLCYTAIIIAVRCVRVRLTKTRLILPVFSFNDVNIHVTCWSCAIRSVKLVAAAAVGEASHSALHRLRAAAWGEQKRRELRDDKTSFGSATGFWTVDDVQARRELSMAARIFFNDPLEKKSDIWRPSLERHRFIVTALGCGWHTSLSIKSGPVRSRVHLFRCYRISVGTDTTVRHVRRRHAALRGEQTAGGSRFTSRRFITSINHYRRHQLSL